MAINNIIIIHLCTIIIFVQDFLLYVNWFMFCFIRTFCLNVEEISLVPRLREGEGLVHQVQILGSDGKFSHYEYHYPIHGRSGKV